MSAELVPSGADLADQGQIVWIRVKRFSDKLIHHCWPTVVRGIDVIDAGIDGRPQHGDGFIVVSGWTEYVRASQLHGAVSDPPHYFVG